MWTPFRTEITQICKQLNTPEERFKPVSLIDWENIQKKVFEKFCYPNHSGWIWERLKGDTYSVRFHYNSPFDQLINLVEQSEEVWLFLNETVSGCNKYWFYQGYIKDIVSVLDETTQTSEVYVASKKCEWLLCVNHHNYIIAAGHHMIERLAKVQNTA